MKKAITLLSLFFLTISNSNSQIYLGGFLGLNASKIQFDDQNIQDNFKYIQNFRFGYSSGLSGLFYFSKALNVKTDLLYTQKGFAYSQTYSKGYKVSNFVQISAAGQIDLNPKKKLIFSPYMAPYLGYWISGKRAFFDYQNQNFITDKIYLNSDTSFAYNRLDVGIAVGFEVKFKQNYHQWLVLGARYEQGMLSNDIEKVQGWKNRNLSIYLEYFYRIKK